MFPAIEGDLLCLYFISSIPIMQHQFPLKAVAQRLPPAPLQVLHKKPSISQGNVVLHIVDICVIHMHLSRQGLPLIVTHLYTSHLTCSCLFCE